MATPHTNAPHVTVGQTNKEATINNALDAMDNSFNDIVALAPGATGGSITAEVFRSGFVFRAPAGSASAVWQFAIPSGIKKHFAVMNYTGWDAELGFTDAASDVLVVESGSFGVFYTDGVTIERLTGGFQGATLEISEQGSIIRPAAFGIDFSGPSVTVSEVSDGRVEVAIATGNATPISVSEETGDFTITDAMLDGFTYKEVNSASAVTILIPDTLTETGPLIIEQTGAGQVTFDWDSAVTVNAYNNQLTSAGQYAVMTLMPKGSDVYTLFGNTTA